MSFKVRLAPNFVAEKRYVVDTVFTEWLGLPYTFDEEPSTESGYLIEYENKTVRCADVLFNSRPEADGYLNANAIPSSIKWHMSVFSGETTIPIIFGDDNVSVFESQANIGIDIFASVFFMLTRWEEHVLKGRDKLERFPASASLAARFGFLERPVVDEWIGLLRAVMLHLWPTLVFRNNQSFELRFTHDIDLLNSPVSVKEFAKDVLKRKRVRAVGRRLQYAVRRENPYDLFDYFMNISEKHNALSRFYFMTGHNVPGRDGEPYNSTPLYRRSLQKIANRGHIIGFHPSLLSYNQPAMFASEKLQLEQDAGIKMTEGRQHALRFELPSTWQMWDDHGMEVDSTLGYSALPGFRCGTGCSFRVFNVITRKHLSLREFPLIVMDTTLNVNQRLSPRESQQKIQQLIDISKKFDTPITLLFHNLIDDVIDWNGWKELYDELFT